MATVVERDGDVAVVRFDEGRGNALSWDAMAALERALDEARDARALVVTGAGKVFSAGLDLRACSRFDRAEMVRYVDRFEAFFEGVLTFPRPLVAALNGHAMAGGCVLALACDVRVMASAATMALNEVELGLPFPSTAFEIARLGLPAALHQDAIWLGKTLTAAEAHARGAVHAVSDDVVTAAKERARALAAKTPGALAVTKAMLRAEALERARANAKKSRLAFVDAFFEDDAQQKIAAVVARLERR